jgi:hypothetical protein
MALSNVELLQNLRSQLIQCAGFESDELSTDRKHALDYYMMRPNGTEVPGRSTVVSGDVSAVVEANLASSLEAFSSANLAEFDALGPDDEDQAALESDAVVDFVMRRNNGRWQLAQAVKDILLLRNGWLKVWIEETKTSRIEEYREVEPEAIDALLERPGAECKVLKYDPSDGYLKLRCVYTEKRFRAEAVAPENIVYPKQYDGCDFTALQRIPFIAERHIDTRSDLKQRGFNAAAVDRAQAVRADNSEGSSARNPRGDNSLGPGVDKSTELVEWWEVYALVDSGDGIAERKLVCTDRTFTELFAKSDVNLVPYATGQCFIAPHRLTGISVWDKTRQTQDINTALQRALLDNVQATSKSRLAYLDGRVNPDDISDGRVNGAIRVKATVSRVSDAVMPFVVPDTSQGIKEAIQHQRQIRTELGGSSLDMQAGELQVSKQVGSLGLDRAFSVAEQLSAHMTQNIADTLIRSVFLLAHATLRENFDTPVEIKRSSGRWQTAIPSEWRPREALTVNVGMSPGERSRRLSALSELLRTTLVLSEQLDLDEVLVSIEGFYDLLLEWARVADIPNPERYFIDPLSRASLEAQERKRQQAQAESQAQQQLVAQAVEIEKLKTAFDKYKADMDAAIEVWAKKVDAAIEYAKLSQAADVEVAELVVPHAAAMLRAGPSKINGAKEAKGAAESDSKPTE